MSLFESVLLSIIGWGGAAATVTAYALVTRRRLEPDSFSFHALNLVGATALCVSASVSAAWPSAVVNVIWILIGAQAVVAAKHQVVRARVRARARRHAEAFRRARQAETLRRMRQRERLQASRRQGQAKRRDLRHRSASLREAEKVDAASAPLAPAPHA
ncbi:MAG TPA: hypothetical protein VK024_00405 [Actinomycetaceae bacterium]|nr:hypothetical protein [Actinomycetaceae bacterium]